MLQFNIMLYSYKHWPKIVLQLLPFRSLAVRLSERLNGKLHLVIGFSITRG